MMTSWFDSETGFFRLDELATQQTSFKKILEDGEITPEELSAQSEKVLNLLQKADKELDEKEHQLVTDLLSEMAVLYAISQYDQLQKFKRL